MKHLFLYLCTNNTRSDYLYSVRQRSQRVLMILPIKNNDIIISVTAYRNLFINLETF